MTTATRMTARDVAAALYAHHEDRRYALLTEVSTWCSDSKRDRRCDLLIVTPTERIAVEIKVTRADFLADVRDPAKQAAWIRLTHRQAYAVPAGLVQPGEVPDGFGLLTVTPGGEGIAPVVQWVKRAPRRPGHTPQPLPDAMIRVLLLRLSQAEAQAKGHAWLTRRTVDATADDLRAQVVRLQRDLTIEQNATARARDAVGRWRRAYGHATPIPCRTCGERLQPGRGHFDLWSHLPAHEAVCGPKRLAAVNEGARYAVRRPPAPEPVELLPDMTR